MRLEDEIIQKKFRNSYHKLAVNLLYTYNWLQPKLRSAMQPYNITTQQYNILRILRGQHPNPASLVVLRERMLDKQSDVSRLVDRLYTKKMIERSPCNKDRRKMDVLITQEGLDLLTEIDTKMPEFDSLFGTHSPDEAETVNTLLDRLRG